MSDFQENLEEEMKKRQQDKTPLEKKVFSFTAFFVGLALLSFLVVGLIAWAGLNAEQTHQAVLEKLPSKTALVQKIDSKIDDAAIQTTLTVAEPTEPVVAPKEETNETGNNAHTEEALEDTAPQSEEAPLPQIQKPLLSIVIAELGLSPKKTEQIIQNFPASISLSFSPYSDNLRELTDMALLDGHDIWLSLPLETKDYPLHDPGPFALLVNATTEDNAKKLNALLNSTKGYAGFITQPNHAFKTEDASVKPAIRQIFEQGLAMIDGNTTSRSFIDRIADRNDYPHAQSDLWLDEDLSASALQNNIQQIIQYGQQGKNVIVMLRPYPASLKTIQRFLNSKAADVFEMAPVSAQLKNKAYAPATL